MKPIAAYLQPLPPEVTLCVYQDDTLIFSRKGKWLYPIFELEDFLASYQGKRDNLQIHDTAIGKGAIVLFLRLGVKAIHGDLVSSLAKEYMESYNKKTSSVVVFSYQKLVPKLLCGTEELFADETDGTKMYDELQRRAKRL